MTISIGTSTPPSVRDTQTAWLRRREVASRAGGEAQPYVPGFLGVGADTLRADLVRADLVRADVVRADVVRADVSRALGEMPPLVTELPGRRGGSRHISASAIADALI